MKLSAEDLIARVAQLETELARKDRLLADQAHQLSEALQRLERSSQRLSRSELELGSQTRILKSVLDGLGEGVLVADVSGRFLLHNPAAREILGMNLDDDSYVDWQKRCLTFLPDMVTPFPPEQMPLARALRGEETDEVEEFMRHEEKPDGIWLAVTGRPLRDERGEVQGGVVVFRDVTQRRLAEDALRDSEALYQSLVESLPLNILRKNLQGLFTFGNKVFLRGLGVTLADLIGKTDFDFFPAHHAEKYRADDQRVVATGCILDDVEEHRDPDGKRTFVHVIKAPVRDALGNVVGVQGIFWDVTDKKMAEEKLQETLAELGRSNQDLEYFAYVASHDLQEPLRMVASFCQLLKRRYQGKLDADADEFIGYAVDGAQRMQALINDLLAFSRVGTRGKPMQAVDLNEVLQRSMDNLRLAIQESGVRITHDTLPVVPGDHVQLVQLIQNLLSNAIKFRALHDPAVHVGVASVDGEWRIAVTDNGIGIDPKNHEAIFVIFHRLHTREEYPGTGIGLAMCKKIVERHGGRIGVTSSPGQGSSFWFTLPKAPPVLT